MCLCKQASWEGEYNATTNKNGCINQDSAVVASHEDCLYLNVFTARLPNATYQPTVVPVFFWIYGGSLVDGDLTVRAVSVLESCTATLRGVRAAA